MEKHPSKPVLSFFFLFFLSLNIFLEMGVAQNTSTVPVNVGVVLDLGNLNAKVELSCINMALSDFYAAHGDYKTRLVLTTRDSKKDVVGAAAAALDLIKNAEVQAIIGPTTSMQANFVIELGEKAQVPIISFSASSPSLTSIRSPYFFRATQNDSSQVNAISALVQAFRWKEVVPIYVDNEYGEGFIPYFTDSLQSFHARVPYRSAISPSATDDQIGEELYKLMTRQTRVFVVHMFPSLGTRVFAKAKEIGMMSEGYVWIMTDGLTNTLMSSPNTSVTDTMQGVLGVKPYVSRTNELENFRVPWKRNFQQDNPEIVDAEWNIYGLWAYDAATALALAVEKSGTTNLGFRKANVSSNSSTDLATLGISLNGPNLLQALSNISFKGLTGDYLFINGELESPAFQIVNVNGNGGREIGFWTPKGLVKTLNSTTNESTYASSNSNLLTIIWPGDKTSIPSGWEIPMKRRPALRIGVPARAGFTQFLMVTRDPKSNTTELAGYCIDVFQAVVKALPYALSYQYIPFAKPDGEDFGEYYDDLIYQVYLKKYDAAVGDITIVPRRSLYVDFTLPFTQNGLTMVVPIRYKGSENTWVFLKPLTWDLWAASLCFFIFIGFVIWVLEHRINEDFGGPPSQQAGTSLWFSFSTMVFAHRERVISNLSRVVVFVWCFVVLTLTQSYTASLSSLLTLQQLQPTVTDVQQLINKGEYVGYQSSFVREILLGLGFEYSKLIGYNSPEECEDLFSKGSGNGGIAAALDEVPYMQLFMSKSCLKYTMIDPTLDPMTSTGGFGFVFPRGSPLVSDVSRAILNVMANESKQIDAAWFSKNRSCPDSSNSNPSNSLSLKSFWGLFLIAGIVSLSALIIFMIAFVYEKRRLLLTPSDSSSSIRTRIRNLLRIFNQRDFTHQNFRESQLNDRNGINLPGMGEPSQSADLVHAEFPGDPSSTEDDDSSPTSETPRQVEINTDQLTNTNQERPAANGTDYDNN